MSYTNNLDFCAFEADFVNSQSRHSYANVPGCTSAANASFAQAESAMPLDPRRVPRAFVQPNRSYGDNHRLQSFNAYHQLVENPTNTVVAPLHSMVHRTNMDWNAGQARYPVHELQYTDPLYRPALPHPAATYPDHRYRINNEYFFLSGQHNHVEYSRHHLSAAPSTVVHTAQAHHLVQAHAVNVDPNVSSLSLFPEEVLRHTEEWLRNKSREATLPGYQSSLSSVQYGSPASVLVNLATPVPATHHAQIGHHIDSRPEISSCGTGYQYELRAQPYSARLGEWSHVEELYPQSWDFPIIPPSPPSATAFATFPPPEYGAGDVQSPPVQENLIEAQHSRKRKWEQDNCSERGYERRPQLFPLEEKREKLLNTKFDIGMEGFQINHPDVAVAPQTEVNGLTTESQRPPLAAIPEKGPETRKTIGLRAARKSNDSTAEIPTGSTSRVPQSSPDEERQKKRRKHTPRKPKQDAPPGSPSGRESSTSPAPVRFVVDGQLVEGPKVVANTIAAPRQSSMPAVQFIDHMQEQEKKRKRKEQGHVDPNFRPSKWSSTVNFQDHSLP